MWLRGTCWIALGGCNALLDVHDFDPPVIDAVIHDAHDAPPDVETDARPPPIIVEAENYATNTNVMGFAWVERTDISGYSGTALMHAEPTGGGVCTDLTALEMCAPKMTYAITVGTPGTYYMHALMWSSSLANDSAWAALDASMPDRLSHSADSAWRWTRANLQLVDVTAGQHTINIWMRESDARIDAIAISQNTGPEP